MTIPPSRLRRATSLYTREARTVIQCLLLFLMLREYEIGFLFGFGALIKNENVFLLSPGSLV